MISTIPHLLASCKDMPSYVTIQIIPSNPILISVQLCAVSIPRGRPHAPSCIVPSRVVHPPPTWRGPRGWLEGSYPETRPVLEAKSCYSRKGRKIQQACKISLLFLTSSLCLLPS